MQIREPPSPKEGCGQWKNVRAGGKSEVTISAIIIIIHNFILHSSPKYSLATYVIGKYMNIFY